jgi:hypothetical protein
VGLRQHQHGSGFDVVCTGAGIGPNIRTNAHANTSADADTNATSWRHRDYQRHRRQWRAVVLTESGDAPRGTDGRVAQCRQHHPPRRAKRRIVDSGNLNPGASSRPMTINIPRGGDSYHCSIHPSMVGTIFAIVYRRLVPRLGHAQAIGAITHRLCRLTWKILHQRVRYEERGPAVSEEAKKVRARKMIREL